MQRYDGDIAWGETVRRALRLKARVGADGNKRREDKFGMPSQAAPALLSSVTTSSQTAISEVDEGLNAYVKLGI